MKTKFFPLLLLFLVLCSCSSRQDVSQANSLNPEKNETISNGSDYQTNKTNDAKSDSGMFQIGDQVLYPESNALLECTIVSADLFDNVKSAGLSSEEIAYIASQSLYNTSITNPFLLLHVKIMDKEAIEVDYAVDYHGINMLQLLTKDILDDPWAGYLPEMVYYREHSNTKESDYFHYTIEPGEEKSFTVGFLLSDDLNADSGLVIHVGGDTALSTFVDLQIP